MASLADKTVVVYGLAKSGLSAAQLLVRQNARVIGLDRASSLQLPGFDRLEHLGIVLHVGEAFDLSVLEQAQMLVVSPGIPLNLPEIVAAKKRGVEVLGEVELATRFLTVPLVGITGTNGKSTTTALCGHMFQCAGTRTFIGGNLGTALSEAVLSAGAYETAVVELSSFQLEGILDARLNAAAILNLQPDHLERYENAHAYGLAKKRIFLNQKPGDVAIINADDAAVVALTADLGGARWGFSRRTLGKEFVSGAHAVDERCFAVREPGQTQDVVYRITNRALRGAHNLENAMAAALLARARGVPPDAIQKALDTFGGLPHRLELIRSRGGVDYVNDSKATNVDSAVVALRAFHQPVWLIAGGKGKGAPYEPLLDAGKGKLRGVLTIGKDAPAIERTFAPHVPVVGCETLETAVQRACQLASSGDVVLLAPACASYDQFKNFEERGERFRSLVEAL